MQSNAWAHAELIRRARALVVVFPELSLTGYELDAEETQSIARFACFDAELRRAREPRGLRAGARSAMTREQHR
jgi:predicted amidohydrolase